MTNDMESTEEIIMEPGDREWFEALLNAKFDPLERRLNILPCMDHESRISKAEGGAKQKHSTNTDWRAWLVGVGIIIVGALAAYAAFK